MAWEAIEAKVTAAGEKVKELKTAKADKDAVDAAVANLLSLKAELTTALEAAIAAAPDEATKASLSAKLPAAPKGKGKDEKKTADAPTDVSDGAKAADGGLSKNEQKRREKEELKKKQAAEKAAAKAAAAKDAPAKPAGKDAGPAFEEEEEMDPSKYFEMRLAHVNGVKASGVNPYPHKFHTTMQVPDFLAKYEYVQPGGFAEGCVEGLAGRVLNKRSGGKGLIFYDLNADGVKMQIFADARNFTAFQGDNGLAGFMKLVGEHFLSSLGGRVVNTHPALSPSFPGMRGPAEALEYGVKVTGCTLFVVDAGVDTGPIIAQSAVAVEPDDTVESLHERIKTAERQMLVDAVGRMAREGFAVEGRQVRFGRSAPNL